MLLVAGADLYLDRHGDSPVLLVGLLIGGPLLAMLRLDVRRTSLICAAALLIAVLVAVEHHVTLGPDLLTRFAVLGSACAFALWGAHRRVHGQMLRESLRLAVNRAEFLAEASTILGRSLDYQETLGNVTRAAVPQLADWCAVDLLEEREIKRVAVAHADPEMVRLAWDVHERFPPSLDQPGGIAGVIRSGEAMFAAEVDPAILVASIRSEEQLRLLEQLGLSSVMIVPITAGSDVIGCVTFVNTRGSRSFSREDLTTATDLAARAARAIEHARVHRDRDHIARTLQQALLPPALPTMAGLDIAARYRPMGEGSAVGGDFYDCLKVGRGQWLTVLGDVQGKGVEAATLTSVIHHSLRTIALQETSPAQILRRLNDVILADHRDDRFCTLALARLTLRDDGGVDGVLALGGHLPPLVRRRGGGVHPLGIPGTLIGAVEAPQVHDAEFRLDAGDALLLFSDGLSEARRGHEQLSEAGVAELLGSCPSDDARSICDVLENAALEFQGGTGADDVTMLCVRVPDASTARLERSFAATSASVPHIRHAAVAHVEELADVPSDVVALLVTELAANAVVHGARRAGDTVELAVDIGAGRVRCELRNRGAGFDGAVRTPPAEESHGRGLLLVDALSSRWRVERRTDGVQAVWFEIDRSPAAVSLMAA
jgi:serine phosphatase RsbU (regulator of sigma subunit)/anti-sigma regulatory factor (Ser/Thr protein kinase)